MLGTYKRRSTRNPGSPDGAFIVDGKGTLLGFDEALEAMTGWSAARIVGHDRRSLPDAPLDRSGAPRRLFEPGIPIPERSRTVTVRLQCADGSTLEVEALVRRLPGRGERAHVTVLRVLARTSAPTERGAPAADPLTGLVTSRSFLERLDHDVAVAAEDAVPVALVRIDVDHLRKVNDAHGRDAGDRVLRGLADLLRARVGDPGRLARLDSDDFAAILLDSARGEARQIAAALRWEFEHARFATADGRPIAATLSIGTASFPADAPNASDLLERAEEALGEARQMGRNRVWCYVRRPRVPVEVPVFFDGTEDLLVGYTRDLSPSGVFVQTSAPIGIGMRCALTFPLPGLDGKVHVIGRVVRSVAPDTSSDRTEPRIPGMGIEFERFSGDEDRRAIEGFLHTRETTTLRPETGRLSV